MEKIIKTSKTICVILKVLYYSIATVGTLGVFAIVCVSLFKDSITSINGISLIVDNQVISGGVDFSKTQFMPLLYSALVTLIIFALLSCYTIKQLLSIFEPMSYGQPFSVSISSKLKKLSYVTLVVGIVGIIFQIVVNTILYKTFNTSLDSCGIKSNYDIGFIFWFLVIRLFSYIFEYGESLQQLSDETL